MKYTLEIRNICFYTNIKFKYILSAHSFLHLFP